MDLQKLVNAMNDMASETRGQYHLTLGGLAEALKGAKPDAQVRFEDGYFPGNPHSYRGYYSDLAFERVPSPTTVKDFLREVEDAIGSTFEGYKGGDFRMHSKTPLWVSNYGSASGVGIMGFRMEDDHFVLEEKQID